MTAASVVADTGPLVAIADVDDDHHRGCVQWFDNFAGAVIVPAPVVVEVCWLLGRRIGPAAEAGFLSGLVGDDPHIEALSEVDYQRSAQLVERHADMDLGFVDASVITVAERLGVATIATINHRDFRVVRPSHCEVFELVP